MYGMSYGNITMQFPWILTMAHPIDVDEITDFVQGSFSKHPLLFPTKLSKSELVHFFLSPSFILANFEAGHGSLSEETN
jgi:hypothetical protein